ncbi:FmdE family protein [Desulfovibrio ferrophilus]|uniref:Formylmethanofuran dehydrogenase subunit E domain-containing protein n=1 Tax=Desulfovibrio ferrophilus TaxID=241368 RepID=A0A2Z6AUU9_9BACT|nr:FmdE family protein [Desulfovibrio ferrophilus]BBD06990.1 formylmethanofuran dehydrogenase subunit E domain-containing protein [Desulfovibrio ferrophilus]
MNIGEYTFEEFKEKAREFHGYPAPGLLIGGYMVEEAKKRLPKDTLFEAMVESGKCLPDAVQLLTLCSVGNNWMKVLNLGRYAVSLYDKFTGEGFRVAVDAKKLENWPEIRSWFLKLKPKAEQDTEKLFAEIETAGPSICSIQPIVIDKRWLGHAHMGGVHVCPSCGEPYPGKDGAICRGCQGEAPYQLTDAAIPELPSQSAPELEAVAVEDAVGGKALHDMTEIKPGETKEPAFKAGQALTAGDVCRLQQMGKHHVYVEGEHPGDEWVHENDAVEAFAKRIAGDGIAYDLPASEGKINFRAEHGGLLSIDLEALTRFNMAPDVMCATRQGDLLVEAGKDVAGSRAIPLYISRDNYSRALAALGDEPLLSVLPLRKAKVGILVTGTEVFQGLIEDKFAPIITSKIEKLGSEVRGSLLVPDDREKIADGVRQLIVQGADLIVTTAGMSVDPDDVTRHALADAGMAADALYGMPVLPGTMTLIGHIGPVQVLGVPACALFYKTTGFDLILPRLLAGKRITRADLARLGEGGFCLQCKACTFPKCPFGK